VVELSARRAQVDHPARRIALTDHLSERGGIDRDVSALSLTGRGKTADQVNYLQVAGIIQSVWQSPPVFGQ
jgi:hypothetical protein